MAEKKEEKKVDVQKEAPEVNVLAFKARKLKAINKMTNKAKAKAAAERVLNNR